MKIQRYRINLLECIAGGIFTPNKIVKYDRGDVWIDEQRHGYGGWCKWDQVKALEKENKRLKEFAEETLKHWVENDSSDIAINTVLEALGRKARSGRHE